MSRQHLTDATRAALVESAIHEFAAHGFDAASTRAIAARAGVHQPQINYHFDSKAELWRAAVDHLFDELDGEIAAEVVERLTEQPDAPVDGRHAAEVAGFAETVRAFVRHAARRPELNRIMVKESSVASDRLWWLVERHIRSRFDSVTASWERLRVAGLVLDVDALTAFYMLLGAGSLLYTNAPEARLLSGTDPLDPARIEAHAEAMVAMLFVGPDNGATRTSARRPTAARSTAHRPSPATSPSRSSR